MKKRPAILVIGGHAWITGEPEPLLSVVKGLDISDAEIIPVPYNGFQRFGTFKSMVATITNAIDRHKRIDRDLYLCGYSAGGQLAMIAAAKRQDAVAGVIAVSAPLDFSKVPDMNHIVRIVFASYNPIKWAASIKIPVMLIHGLKDKTVLPDASIEFCRNLPSKTKCEVLTNQEMGHTASLLTIYREAVIKFITG